MSIIDKIIQEAENELGISKIAGDPNGAPSNPSNSAGGKQDIISTANAFMQEVEQFKAQLGQAAMGAAPINGEEDPDAMAQAQMQAGDPNAAAANPNAGGATIQTPGGTVIKIASLIKLAALKGGDLFKEVK